VCVCPARVGFWKVVRPAEAAEASKNWAGRTEVERQWTDDFNRQRIVKKFSWQKKWSGHGQTGRTADYGLVVCACVQNTMKGLWWIFLERWSVARGTIDWMLVAIRWALSLVCPISPIMHFQWHLSMFPTIRQIAHYNVNGIKRSPRQRYMLSTEFSVVN